MTLATAFDPIRAPGTRPPEWPGRAPLARLGTLEVRLAESPAERESAFALRHAVFVAERGLGVPGAAETDVYDRDAFHLVVLDTDAAGQTATVGTCRLILPQRQHAAVFAAGSLFALDPLLEAHPGLRFCEVGRACVRASHRRHGVVEALWRGLWVVSRQRKVDVLFGAASFPGTDARRHADAIAALTTPPPPPGWRVAPRPEVAAPVTASPVRDRGRVLRTLPPLIRAYAHLGALFSTGAAIDHGFGTTDLLVMTRLAAIPPRYRAHFAGVTGTP